MRVPALALMHGGFTHPAIAVLGTPLFRKRQRGEEKTDKNASQQVLDALQ